MDLKRLEVFCRVIELKSFTRAAEAVLLAQPTVSEHVRLLEEEVGEKLVDRLGREVLPTGAGEILYRHATRILRLRDEALQAMAEYGGELAGRLLLGASTIPGAFLLPARIADFKKIVPQVRITLQIANSARVVRQLLEGEIELGLVGSEPKDGRLSWEPLFADELVLVVAPDHPWASQGEIALSDLANMPLLWRERESGTRQAAEEALVRAGFNLSRLDVVAEMGSGEAVRQGVRAGVGAAILSSLAVADDLAHGLLKTVTIDDLTIHRSFFFVSRRGRHPSPLARAFTNHLKRESF